MCFLPAVENLVHALCTFTYLSYFLNTFLGISRFLVIFFCLGVYSPQYTMVHLVSTVLKNYADMPLLLCILCNRFCRRCLESIVGFPIKMWFVQILYCLHD